MARVSERPCVGKTAAFAFAQEIHEKVKKNKLHVVYTTYDSIFKLNLLFLAIYL